MASRKKGQNLPSSTVSTPVFTSWFFALGLGAAMLYAALGLSTPDANSKGAALHVTQRYLERGPVEAGISNPTAAVFFDYRSFDLWAIGILFFLAAVLGLLPRLAEGNPPYLSKTARISLLFSLIGLALGLGLGLFSLYGGSNFLDYEPLTAFCKPICARETGDWLLGASVLSAFLGVALALKDHQRSWEDLHGH